ncbi:MAG: hypothetical protein N3E45_10220 [Oscillatoriaceae bacterium SKW80]|nr:hypothetical protein [Oscillatoriaceae bacterium SKYG93]MCX8121191.1 hypothetical protein [Oscillatoriaceae bacterium SKW80]MDW8453479.1 hypothetical protein [Oscillatoriaceae cyanobacterium SKYGB_i_bin93]HIK26829.1 hypothetical protein [Oscillatoriaceae cyanobacterium M7585_C2015_266]
MTRLRSPEVSAALRSEMFSYATTWQILTEKGKVAGRLEDCQEDLTVEVWARVIWVRLTRNILRRDCPWGVSTFISYKDYLEKAVTKAINRARSWELVSEITETTETCRVRSRKAPNQEISLRLYTRQIFCNCEQYRCLNNHIWAETPRLRALIDFHKILGGQIPCPHAVAVLNFLGYRSFGEYFKERRDREEQAE